MICQFFSNENEKEKKRDKDSPHDSLFQSVSNDQSVDIDNTLLTKSVSSVHCLLVFGWVPIVLHKDDGVCPRQVQPNSSHLHSHPISHNNSHPKQSQQQSHSQQLRTITKTKMRFVRDRKRKREGKWENLSGQEKHID